MQCYIMAKTKYYIGFIVISLCLMSSVKSSFICYTCLYPDKGCGDDFQPLVPTSSCSGSCLKIRGERWSGSVRNVEVYRLCGAQMKEDCESDVMYNGMKTTRCACNSNYCNHGNHIVASWLTITGIFTVFFVIMN